MSKGGGGSGRGGRSSGGGTVGNVEKITQNGKDGFQRVIANFPVQGGFRQEKGEKIGDYLVHQQGGIGRSYQVTHIPSGLRVVGSNSGGSERSQAKQAAAKLSKSNISLPKSYEQGKNLSYEQSRELAARVKKVIE